MLLIAKLCASKTLHDAFVHKTVDRVVLNPFAREFGLNSNSDDQALELLDWLKSAFVAWCLGKDTLCIVCL